MKLLLETWRRHLREEESIYNSWVMPDDATLKREFYVEHGLKRLNCFDSEEAFISAARSGKVEEITPEKDKTIVYRSRIYGRHVGDPDALQKNKEALKNLLMRYRSWPEFRNEETLNNLYARLENNEELDMPIVLDLLNGKYRIFAGNTRMDVAFQMGINPRVLVIKTQNC
jgi:hypothetical protein